MNINVDVTFFLFLRIVEYEITILGILIKWGGVNILTNRIKNQIETTIYYTKNIHPYVT